MTLPLPWGGRRVPFTLLGGYLGAGKTTIVNHVLEHAPSRLLVLVNDVGAVSVDASLIAAHDGQTIELNNGCVCCAVVDDFAQTLEQVRSWNEPPGHVLMELSGVGRPTRLAAWANTSGFRLDGIVVCVDAEQVRERAAQRYVGDTVLDQLASADLLVVNKCDLVDAEQLAELDDWLEGVSAAPSVHVSHGAVNVELLLGLERSAGLVEVPPVDDGHLATVIDVPIGISTSELDRWLAELDGSFVRAKGIVRCSDSDAPIEVQVVGHRRSTRPRPDLAMPAVNQVVAITVPH